MKHFAMLLLVLVSAGAALGQNVDELPSITTTGSAQISVNPDSVDISLDVTNVDMDLEKAKRENDEVVRKIGEVAAKHGIEPRNVSTSRISVERTYEYISDGKKRVLDEYGDEVGRKVFKGYEVSKSIQLELGDVSKFEAVFAELLTTGLSEVSNVSFTTSKLREYKDQARDMAMKAAREKAVAMAGAIDQSVGKAINISEGNVDSRYISLGVLSANSQASVGQSRSVSEKLASFDPGSITISATVTVHFLLD